MPLPSIVRTALRRPLLHFLAGGTLLYVVGHGASSSDVATAQAPPSPIVLDAAEVARLLRDYARNTGSEPTADDEAALIARAVEEELLYREALARGLDRDRSVRNWLVEQMRTLDPDLGDDAALYARALELGLDRSDLVVRRLLIQKMRLLAARENEQPPTDTELRAYYAEHAADYAIDERVTFWHVFSARSSAARATELLAELRDESVAPARAARRSETFLAPPHLRAQTPADLARRFGAGFATALETLPLAEWSGPVASQYGWHAVWIEERTAGELPPLETVRGQLTERWLTEQRARRLASTLRELAARYPLHVESEVWQRGRS